MSQPTTDISKPPAPRDQVIRWLIDGHSDSDIREAIAATWPNANAAELAASAVEHFANSAECDLPVVVGWALEAYRGLYRRMLGIGDFAGAMKAVKELVALAEKHRVISSEEDDQDGQGEAAPAISTD